MSWVHRAAAAGFAASAEEYERARPGYPDEAIEWLTRELGLEPGRTVVDLAAGTGKLTRRLAATGARVIGVEPIAEMRALIPAPAEPLEGTAEAVPVPDGTADAVTVAQAFHWFAGDRALAEIHRVLRPGGALALVWNSRREDDPLMAAAEEIVGPYRGETPHHRTGRWRDAFDRTTLFGPLEEWTFPNSQTLDAETVALRFGTTSVIAALPEPERTEVVDRLRALAGDRPATLHYTTEVFLCRRRSASVG